jgi:hypothetical protein
MVRFFSGAARDALRPLRHSTNWGAATADSAGGGGGQEVRGRGWRLGLGLASRAARGEATRK